MAVSWRFFFFEEELREQGVGEGAIVKYLAKRFFIGYNVTLGLMSKEATVFVARKPQERFGTARATVCLGIRESCGEFVWEYGKVVCCLEFVWRIRESCMLLGVCLVTRERGASEL